MAGPDKNDSGRYTGVSMTNETTVLDPVISSQVAEPSGTSVSIGAEAAGEWVPGSGIDYSSSNDTGMYTKLPYIVPQARL